MLHEVGQSLEHLPTVGATETPLRVDELVFGQILGALEPLPTARTTRRPLVTVGSLVSQQVGPKIESLATHRAGEQVLPRVNGLVCQQGGGQSESFATCGAGERPLPGVVATMYFQL